MTVATPADRKEVVRTRVAELLEQERWSRERLLGYQDERLRSLLRHAVEHSAYYREALGADAAERPLKSLPMLSKALLMEQFDSVVTDPALRRRDVERFAAESRPGDLHIGQYRVFSTSGATGVPGLFIYAPDEFVEWVAVGISRLVRVGITGDTRLGAIGAPGDAHITKQLFAAFSAGRGVPRVNVTTPVADAVAALNAYRPEALIAYASVLGLLAEEQLAGRLQIEPTVTLATSEVLAEDIVARVTEAWGAAPLDTYAATEAPGIANTSLDRVGMHVWEESVVIEVVDDDGRPVPRGEPGAKVLLTNLVNRAQPLIRYELSDSVVVAPDDDPSGRPYMRLARVDGRSDDILQLPDRSGGRVRVHPFRLRAPFARLRDVRQYQIVLRADGLVVRIVPRPDARAVAERVSAALLDELAEVGADVTLRVELVDEIERERGGAGKFKLVRSEVASP